MVPDDMSPVKVMAGMNGTAALEKERIRKKSPGVESLPDSGLSLTNQPTSPGGESRPKKKPATFEVAQQEAGPVRAAQKKKPKSRGTRAEPEGNIDVANIEEGDKPRKGGKEKRETKEVKKEKIEKTPGKPSKGTKED